MCWSRLLSCAKGRGASSTVLAARKQTALFRNNRVLLRCFLVRSCPRSPLSPLSLSKLCTRGELSFIKVYFVFYFALVSGTVLMISSSSQVNFSTSGWQINLDLGFRRPACSPLTVVASELTLGATAHEGRGRGGRAVTQTPRRLVARQSSPKQT